MTKNSDEEFHREMKKMFKQLWWEIQLGDAASRSSFNAFIKWLIKRTHGSIIASVHTLSRAFDEHEAKGIKATRKLSSTSFR